MPHKNKQKLYEYQIQRWIKIKHKAIDYKGGCCAHCGYNKYYGALEFHHLDPSQKDVMWTKLRLKSWDKITEELDKRLRETLTGENVNGLWLRADNLCQPVRL